MTCGLTRFVRYWAACWAVSSVFTGHGSSLAAQGVTTATIRGRIVDETGAGVDDADVAVINRSTGSSMRGRSRRDGRYLVAGLEVGGPYSVVVRRIGSTMRTHDGLFLSIGQQLTVDVRLESQPIMLQAVEARASANRIFSSARKGTEALISDSAIRRMPIVNRDIYDLVKLVPQMSTWSALTAPGANPRVNSIRIDGVNEQAPTGNTPSGATLGGKSIPLDAVKEFQVQLSTFDVRHGTFAGANINAVSRSGTNDFQGSAFVYATNERLGRNVPFIRDVRYEKNQFGLSFGGPILRDRLHFFLAAEQQQRLIPPIGPYVGQDASRPTALPVDAQDIARFQSILHARGLDGGSAAAIDNANPASTVFLRFDAPVPRWNSRIVVRGNYSQADSSVFGRPITAPPSNCPTRDCFPLSSLRHTRWNEKRSMAAQLFTNFASGVYNELIVGRLNSLAGATPTVRQPLIIVAVRGTSGQPAVLQSGTHEAATGQRASQWTTEVTNNLTLPFGAHRITLGATTQRYGEHLFQLRGAYGVWQFRSLDSLEAGVPSRYRLTRDIGSVVAVSGNHHALYVGDDWEATSRLSLTLGLRADIPTLSAHPPYVAAVDSLLGLRTERVPSGRVQWSPRIGFNYDATRDAAAPTHIRGGVGVFTGRAPLSWLFGAFTGYGIAARTLQCGSMPGDAGPPPALTTDYRNPPTVCANGQGVAATTLSEIDVIDPHLRLPQVVRGSLAADRQLPLGFVGTIEVLYTHGMRALFFSGANLTDPVEVDRRGRVMYGTVDGTGTATPRRISSRLGDVVFVSNQSKDYAYDVTGQLQKSLSGVADVQLAFTYGRARDVQSQRVISSLLIDNWRFGRTVTGRQDDVALGTSDFDQRFRLRVSGTFHSPWRTLQTDLSFYYVGGSGLPYTYVAGGAMGRGDLNADGAVGNDPIYVPRSALDTAEIQFAGSSTEVAAQQAAFERFIEGATCLQRQRGRIMARNSCRAPWSNLTNVALRQALPRMRGQSVALELQVYNFLNLLSDRWGRVELPTLAMLGTTSQLPVLSQVGATPAPYSQPIYRFDSTLQRYSAENLDSHYQVQLAARYNF